MFLWGFVEVLWERLTRCSGVGNTLFVVVLTGECISVRGGVVLLPLVNGTLRTNTRVWPRPVPTRCGWFTVLQYLPAVSTQLNPEVSGRHLQPRGLEEGFEGWGNTWKAAEIRLSKGYKLGTVGHNGAKYSNYDRVFKLEWPISIYLVLQLWWDTSLQDQALNRQTNLQPNKHYDQFNIVLWEHW